MVCMPGIPPGDRRAQNACPIYRANRPALRHPVLFFVLLCNTLEVIMQTTLTVRLSQQDAQELDAICASTGKSRSEVVRESLRAYRLREALRQSQSALGPAARAAGWLTEDDVLRDVS